jgi:hypothetical protein
MSKTAAQEIIERSGNSFHSRVVNLLRDQGWGVMVSPHYNDNFTDKPREIDIIAEKKFNVTEFFNEWLGTLNVRLFIECKYVPSDTVFWFEQKDKERALQLITRSSGMEAPHRDSNTQKHHYYTDTPIAKLYASNTGRSEDNEAMNRATNQVLNAAVYYRNRGDLQLTTTEKGYIDRVLRRVSYPLIVVNSFEHFYATAMKGGGEVEPIIEPFQLEVNYAYTDKERNGHNEYFLIDVVSFDKLTEFLVSSIEKADAVAISEKIKWDKRVSERQSPRNSGIDYI